MDNFLETISKIVTLHTDGKLAEALEVFDEIDEKDRADPIVVKLRERIAADLKEQS